MKKIFFDTNVLLDVVLSRDSDGYAESIIHIAESADDFRIYASYLSMANIAFVLRRGGKDSVRGALAEVMRWCTVLPCNDMQILEASRTDAPDYEDALQIMCAEHKKCDVIITRNAKHFRQYTDVPVMSPEEFMSHC